MDYPAAEGKRYPQKGRFAGLTSMNRRGKRSVHLPNLHAGRKWYAIGEARQLRGDVCRVGRKRPPLPNTTDYGIILLGLPSATQSCNTQPMRERYARGA